MSYPQWADSKTDPFQKLFNDDFDAPKTAAKFTVKAKAADGAKIKVDGKSQANGNTEGSFEIKTKLKNGKTETKKKNEE